MRIGKFSSLLSAAFLFSVSACFPEYSFDLSDDANDAAAPGDEPGLDGSTGEEPDSSLGDNDAGVDSGDAEPDGDITDADNDPGDADSDVGDADGDSGDADSDADADLPPPPDPDCSEGVDGGVTGYECVERPPSGWSGPVALYHELAVLGAPSCPALFHSTPIFEGFQQANTAPAACSKCTCSNTVKGITCAGPKDSYYSEPGCSEASGGCGWLAQEGEESLLVNNVCVGIAFNAPSDCGPPGYLAFEAPEPSGAGSCTPSPQSPSIPLPSQDIAQACHAPTSTKGCEGGAVCAPKLDDDHRQRCIVSVQAGDVECPSGPYSEKRVFYQSADDTRACTSCECGPATNVSCNAEVKSYAGQSGCVTEDGVIAPNTCGAFPKATEGENDGQPAWIKLFRMTTSPSGTCAPSGGQPTGSVEPSGPAQTVCCMP